MYVDLHFSITGVCKSMHVISVIDHFERLLSFWW